VVAASDSRPDRLHRGSTFGREIRCQDGGPTRAADNTKESHVMRQLFIGFLILAAVVVGGSAIANVAYQAGVQTAVTTVAATAPEGTIVTPVAPAYGYGYGYGYGPGWGWHGGPGFGIFGFLIGLFFIFLFIGLLRAAFGRGRGWGDGRGGWGGPGGWGPGGPRRWAEHEGVKETFETLHRESHSGSGGGASGTGATTGGGTSGGATSGGSAS
jgi:hypothetical protein